MIVKHFLAALLLAFCYVTAAITPATVFAAPSPPSAPLPLPIVDPQARQILAAMINTYRSFAMQEYEDEETFTAAGDTTSVSSEYVNSKFTVVLNRGFGVLLTQTDASGEKVTVHAFRKDNSQADRPFLIITIDSRFPGLYVKDVVTDYQEALAHSFSSVGLGTLGAGALFSERDISSLLVHPAFQGLRLGQTSVVDGVPCDSVMIEIDNGRGNNTITLYIGQKDHLMRRLTLTHVQGAQTTTVTEKRTRIRASNDARPPFLFPPSYFLYAPPRGYRSVKFFPSPVAPARPAVTPPVTSERVHGAAK